MTGTHYISIHILLTKDDADNLANIDVSPINLAHLTGFCGQYQTSEHLPISMLPILSRHLYHR